MDPFKYQKMAQRTECNQREAQLRMTIPITRLNHAALGLCGDAGEVAAAIERHVYYGQPLDELNVIEELGDCLWYIAQMCNALDVDMGNVMATNLGKLQKRYPEKFDSEKAKEENRDRKEEMKEVAKELTTVEVELTDTDMEDPIDLGHIHAMECKTCGTDERCTDGDGRSKTVKQLCSGHICPSCSTTISDEVVKRLYMSVWPSAHCPACLCQFALRTSATSVTTLKLEKLDAEASKEE